VIQLKHKAMKKTFKQLEQEIRKALVGKYAGETATEEILTKICGQKVSCYDSVIDDGVDDDDTEEEYVMRDCFSTADDKITIRIYYGDCTMEIGYVSVNY
jgi:hypothetical protein